MKADNIQFPLESREFLRDTFVHGPTKTYTLAYWIGQFWSWNDGAWQPMDKSTLHAILNAWATRKNKGFRPSHIQELAKQISWDVYLNVNDSNVWIGTKEEQPHVIAFENGLLDLDAYACGNVVMLPKDPRWFSSFKCPYAFSTENTCDRWYWALESWFGPDSDQALTLQEIFGYMLSGHRCAEKMFVLMGKSGSGKSTALAALRAMMGQENCHASSIEALGGRFGTASLVDKTLCELPDQRAIGANRNTALQVLLGIVGLDMVRIEPKNQGEYSKCLPTRFIMSCNDIPNLEDSTGAFLRRVIVLPFRKSHILNPDTALKDDIISEAPGIVLWALEGYRRLKRNGFKFTEGIDSLEAKLEYEADMNPVSVFVQECLEIKDGSKTAKQLVWDAWVRYCQQTNRNPGTDTKFFRDLYGTHPLIVGTRVRFKGERIYIVEGCHIKEKWLVR